MSKRPPSPKAIPAGKWRRLRASCLDQLGEPSTLEVEMVNLLVLNLIAADRALADAQRTPIVPGSKGQDREHPGFAVANRCAAEARATAAELLLTPRRKRAAAKNPGPDSFSELDELAVRRGRR